MQTNILIFILSALLSMGASAQVVFLGEGSTLIEAEQYYQNAVSDNFTEFTSVYIQFMNQNRRLIEAGEFKQARELLTPFLDQFRARLGFTTKSHLELVLKNQTAEEIALVQKELAGAFIGELALSNLSSTVRDNLLKAIGSSVPNQFFDSLFSYKRVLLLYLTAVLGENNQYSSADKQMFARNVYSDFLFLVAPIIKFNTPEPNRYLVLLETELNPAAEQMVFDADLLDFVKKYSAYFSFLNKPATIEADFKRFKKFQQNIIRRTSEIKSARGPSSIDKVVAIEPTDYVAPPAAEEPIVAMPLPAPAPRQHYSRPTAVVTANARGSLQFDLGTLTEIADSDASLENMVHELKVYLTSSTMIWGQSNIQFPNSFTHSNSYIKVLVKNFPLTENFVSSLTELYYAELYNFFLFGKEALIRKNTLENRDQVYNCLVRMSLAPVTINCDGLLQITSMFDDNNRKKFADAYARLLRLSRITFEFSSEQISYLPNTQTTCGRILALQKELLVQYKSTASSYLPSLINIQGPAFKNTSTGKREFLCKGSLNPFLQ